MCKKANLKKMSRILTALIMTLILMLNITPATRVSAYLSEIGTFDLDKANEYALMYAKSYNPYYGVYGTDGTCTFNPSPADLGPNGTDCAHYVSQILIYAGANVKKHINVNAMRNYYVDCGIEYISSPSVSQIEAGDILYTSSSHVMFVQRVVNGTVYATGHTTARLDFPVSLRYGVLKTSVMCNNNSYPSSEMYISGADASKTIYQGDNFNISGIISSGLPLTSAKLNFIDGVGNTIWSYEMNPNGSTSFNIANSIQHLPVGVHKLTVTASNSERTNVTLYEKTFAVLSHENTLANGTYKISYSSNSTYLMGAAGFNSGDNVNLYIDASQSGKPGNVWYIQNEGNGYYIIRNFGTGYYLDVANGSSQDGTNVSQWELNRGDGQLWQILPAGGGTYCLVPKCATESGADVNSGNHSNIEIYGLHLGVNQRFVFTRTDSSFTSGNKITFNTNGGTLPSSFANHTVDGVNKDIDIGELIIYNTPGQTVKLPDATYVMAVVNENGQVKHYSKYVSGDEDTIPSNGFVIVGRRSGGDDGASFLEQVQLADYLGYNSSTKTVYAYKSQNSYLANHKYVESGSVYGDLPTPIRSGYDFDGWYTSASGGTKVTSNSYYSTSTLYAHWKTASGVVPINSTTFPDDNFRAYVSKSIDEDKSGWLSEDEITYTWTINVDNKGINNLTGIEYFTSLQYLYCKQNNLTSIDLSKNKNLKVLRCSYNKLVSLDLSNNTNLFQIFCFKNNLINVNVSNTKAVETSFICTSDSQGTAGTENNFNIGTVKSSYSLSNITKYGFVSSKASNWKGATYNASTNSLTNFTSTKISYDYDCGNGLTATFYLTADSIPNSNNGDLNNDGKVDLKDLAFMKSILAKDDTSQYTGSADLNGDGKVNLRDLAALKYLLASN